MYTHITSVDSDHIPLPIRLRILCIIFCTLLVYCWYLLFPIPFSPSGVCPAAEDAAPMMILELMPYGDLQSFLEANR